MASELTSLPALESTSKTTLREKWQKNVGIRHLEVFLLFLCMVTAYIIRVDISLAIVSMTRDTEDTHSGKGSIYEWNPSTKGYILSSFFIGYMLMNLPAAVIGHQVDNKMLLGGSFAVASVLSILTPLLLAWWPRQSAAIMIVIRVIQGLAQAFLMPMIHGLLSRWAPPQERARLASFVLVGLNFGSMVVLSMSGLLASSQWGWPSIFFISGGLGLFWLFLWMLFGSNDPQTHPLISEDERNYIVKSLGNTAKHNELQKMSIPWKAILTSGPVWAVVCAHLGMNWGMWTLLTEMPTYFSKALNLDLKKDGFITAFPYFLMWIISYPLSYMADRLIIKGYTSVTVSRKIWNSIAQYGGAAALVGMAFAGNNPALAIILYTIAVTVNCCVYMGFNVNHLDLSPNFAGILMGITNGIANITSIIAPIFVGAVIHDETNVDNWRVVFICSACVSFLANTVFLVLGSAKLQPWNGHGSES